MTYSGYPPPPPLGGAGPGGDPGPIPLRPMRAGDLLGAGFGVVRRHLVLLGSVSVLIAALSSAASLGILAGSGSLTEFATGAWYPNLLSSLRSGQDVSLPGGMYLAVGVGWVLSMVGSIAVTALAAACAGVDAIGRHARHGATADRLAGRIPALVATSVVVGIAVSIGLMLLVVPGVLIYLAWAAAAPVAAMERSGPAASLHRSVRLTRGHRGRILGMTLLVLVIAYAIETAISTMVLAAAGTISPVGSLILSDAVTAVVAAVTTSWTGAVIALLYVDLRIRTEDLGPALRAFAAADRRRGAAGPALGSA